MWIYLSTLFQPLKQDLIGITNFLTCITLVCTQDTFENLELSVSHVVLYEASYHDGVLTPPSLGAIRIKLHPCYWFSLYIGNVISVVSTLLSFSAWTPKITCQGKTNYSGALIVKSLVIKIASPFRKLVSDETNHILTAAKTLILSLQIADALNTIDPLLF